MNRPDFLAAADIDRLRDAGEWVQRLAESSEPAIADQWAAWCDADPQNLETFEQMQAVWLSFNRPQAAQVRALQRAVRPRRRRVAALAASVGLMIGTCAWIAMHYFGAQAFDTVTGAQRRVVLSDGSIVDLAPDSHLSVRFTPWQRDVRLERGEAFFSVAHGGARPFVVHAAELKATAVGTAFDVRIGANDTVVTVSEGRVDVAAREIMPAHGGQRVTLSARAPRLRVANVDPVVAGSWRSGTLQFLSEPLEEVVSEVNRYADRKITVAAPFRQTRFTGTIAPSQVADWLKALEQIYAVEVDDRGGNGIYIEARGPHDARS